MAGYWGPVLVGAITIVLCFEVRFTSVSKVIYACRSWIFVTLPCKLWFRWILQRVKLVEKREGYPTYGIPLPAWIRYIFVQWDLFRNRVVPYSSPMLGVAKICLWALKGHWRLHVNTFGGLADFNKVHHVHQKHITCKRMPPTSHLKQMKTPCMLIQTAFAGFHVVVICEPEAVRHVLFNKDKIYLKPAQAFGDAEVLLGHSVLLAEGDDWHHQREGIPLSGFFFYVPLYSVVPWLDERLYIHIPCDFWLVLNPFFKYKNLRSLVPLFCESTTKLIGMYYFTLFCTFF